MTKESDFTPLTLALMDAAHELTSHADDIHNKLAKKVGPALFQSITWHSSLLGEDAMGETFFVLRTPEGRAVKSQLPSLDSLGTILCQLPLRERLELGKRLLENETEDILSSGQK